MGDLQKRLFQKKLREAEASLGLNFSEDLAEDEDIGTSFEQESTEHLPPLRTERYQLKHWNEYFDEKTVVEDSDGNKFTGFYTPPKSAKSPVFIFHHGAGSSALSFGLLAKEIIRQTSTRKHKNKTEDIAGVFAFDARGHGESVLSTNKNDMSIEMFVKDSVFVIDELIKRENLQNNPIFLVGHSLGGAVFIKVTHQLKSCQMKGLAIFDIVEDTAVQALEGMHSFLSALPSGFPTLSDAIDYHLKSNILRNKESAILSVPHLLEFRNGKYEWILDLRKTAPYWDRWFTGLSKNFVDAKPSKLLILAGSDNLDKQLIIGQMQGKYQLVVFQDSGHFIQEDLPEKTALALIDFWERNDRNQTTIKSTWGSKK